MVDDEPDWRAFFSDVLDSIGLQVDAVAGVAAAKALLLRNEYALVLLDAVLDTVRGTLDSQILLDVLRTKYPRLPVVATTGKPLKPPEVVNLSKLGFVDLVYKPEIQLDNLRRVLRQAVKSQQPSGGLLRHVTVLALDAVRFSRHGILVQVAWRDGLWVIVGEAIRKAGIPENAIQLQDRGDGIFGVIGEEVPKATVVVDLVRELHIALQAYNRTSGDAGRIRLRMALHQGDVAPREHGGLPVARPMSLAASCGAGNHDCAAGGSLGGTGSPGDAEVVASRLVDAPAVRGTLADSPDADLVLIISAELHRSTLSEDHHGLDLAAFRKVDVGLPRFTSVAWVTVPDPARPAAAGQATGTGKDRCPPVTFAEPREAAGWDFLVSVADADQSWGAWIAWQLEQRDYRVHLETWDRRAGDHKVGWLEDAITHSARTLVVLSDNYLRSEAVKAEWQAAWQADPNGMQRKLIPVRVADCNPAGLLGAITYIDLVGATDTEAESMLIEQIKKSIVRTYRPTGPPPFPGTHI